MTSKVALVTCSSLRYSPYMDIYKSILTDLGIEYIIVNEHEIDPVVLSNHYTYDRGVQAGIFKKIIKFFGWRKFLISILKKENVNKVIVFTTWPGVKMFDFWTKKYKNNYILDIRDFSYEGNWIYRKIVVRLIQKSYITNISSEKFKEWLIETPKLKVIHNMPVGYKEKERCIMGRDGKYVIGYVGRLNYDFQNRAIIDACEKYSCFQFKFKGTIASKCYLKEYCESNNKQNVVFTGKYDNSQKAELYDDIDIINAVYGNDSLVVTTALPNKLYDTIIYKKPLMASDGTYLGELAKEYKIGFTIDVRKDNIAEEIKKYIAQFNEEEFLDGCKKLLEKVWTEQKNTEAAIKNYLLS